jgi:uncharacterized protein YqeY
MGLFEKINEDLKAAMKGGDKEKVGIYRMVISEIKKAAIDKKMRDEIKDELVIASLTKAVKSRKESVAQYSTAGREDLAAKEEAEIEVISAYLPSPLTDEEIMGFIEAAISETQASGKKDMGKVMKVVMPNTQGRADGKKVQQMVLERLGKG